MELVPYSDKFLEIMFQWRYEPASVAFNPLDDLNKEQFQEKLSNIGSDLDQYEDFDSVGFIAFVQGQPVGNVNVHNINHRMQSADIGYAIGEEFFQRGYGTEMLNLFLGEVFAKTKLRRIQAFIHVENKASIRLVEKMGFCCEGQLRDYVLIHGKPVDNFVYGILSEEFVQD